MSELLMCGRHKNCIVSYQVNEVDEDKFDEEEQDSECPMCIIESKLVGIRATIDKIFILTGVKHEKTSKCKKKLPGRTKKTLEMEKDDDEWNE